MVDAKPSIQLSNAVREVAKAMRDQRDRELFERKLEVSKHLMSLANLAAGALLFGQAFSGFPFDLRVAMLGLLVVIGLYAISLSIMRGGDQP